MRSRWIQTIYCASSTSDRSLNLFKVLCDHAVNYKLVTAVMSLTTIELQGPVNPSKTTVAEQEKAANIPDNCKATA